MPSTRKQQIASLVRDARNAKGWTQDELADRVDVHTSTISHIERAKHKPERNGLLEKLEDALEVDLSAEAMAGHAMVDEVVRKLTDQMRALGPVDGLRIAADTLEFVENWRPKRRAGQDGDSEG